jgi:iron(III) transport system permease protein
MEKPIRYAPTSSATVSRKLVFPRVHFSGWTVLVIAIAFLISTPVLFVLGNIFTDSGEVWKHLAETVLWRYITNSFWLMMGVGCGVLVIGVGTAWLVTMCRFPGSRLFEWGLLLPLAAPAYVLAYTYTDFLEFSGALYKQHCVACSVGGMGTIGFPMCDRFGGQLSC